MRTKKRTWSLALLLVVLLPLGACANNPPPRASEEFEHLLLAADWRAVDVAKQQGATALPILRRSNLNRDYRIRQIAVTCAGRIGAEGADLLSEGLRDSNINVRQAAANELAAGPWPAAAAAILEQIGNSADETVRETLVLAAGYLPGNQTLAVLRPLATGDQDSLAVNVRMALARLGDPVARQSLLAGLLSTEPHIRYETLDRLRYVNDAALADRAMPLLSDHAAAFRTGTIKAPQYRRVCDQALETVIELRKLRVPFEVNVEKLYSDAELASVKER